MKNVLFALVLVFMSFAVLATQCETQDGTYKDCSEVIKHLSQDSKDKYAAMDAEYASVLKKTGLKKCESFFEKNCISYAPLAYLRIVQLVEGGFLTSIHGRVSYIPSRAGSMRLRNGYFLNRPVYLKYLGVKKAETEFGEAIAVQMFQVVR